MLVFATSDKGGTGRSVTSCNVAYRRALQGGDVCYLDFDFGSPTSGAIFSIDSALRGTDRGGLHAYLHARSQEPHRIDVWAESDRRSPGGPPDGAGRLVLYPGDAGGGEFAADGDMVQRCAALFLRLEEEFDLVLVDLSAGRSYATQIVLAATALPELADVPVRWLVFHRWTRQHVLAAEGLAYGDRGLVDSGAALGHHREALMDSIRFVRTAVVDPNSEELAGLQASQIAWLRRCDDDLDSLARRLRVGRTAMLGEVPLEPVLQWREQLISDSDTMTRKIANQATVDAFETLAKRLTDHHAWNTL